MKPLPCVIAAIVAVIALTTGAVRPSAPPQSQGAKPAPTEAAQSQRQSASTAAPSESTQAAVDKSWSLLDAEVREKNTDRRTQAVRALGLIRNNHRAIEMAEHALGDDRPQVRVAAARSMEQMKCTECISRLKDAVADKNGGVGLAAAHALLSLKDPSAYEVYFAVLTGTRKTQEGLVSEGMETLRDEKKMAQFGFEEGIGFIPFAGMGYSALKVLTKDDVSPVRAAAAAILANDPDPQSAEALVKATSDRRWLVRAAALDAIGKRDDPKLLPGILHALSDEKQQVRDSAAATIIRLDDDAKAASAPKPAPKTTPGSDKQKLKHRPSKKGSDTN